MGCLREKDFEKCEKGVNEQGSEPIFVGKLNMSFFFLLNVEK
jgi:hypothetical protein